ncbi:MAG: efflux RND transporter periplasmic adaptor subunit, partial [Gemmatimonadetes bacterium]|nr:efflux RND transporter periplasmic adaptor subunit [Gemmatimonadota bacterium]
QEAEGNLRVLLAGSRPEEIEAVEAEVARLEAHHRHLEEQLRRLRVVSPISGTVTTPRPQEKVGQYAKKGDLIIEVYEFETVIAEIAISEKDISDVRVGQKVVLKARAFPRRTFEGTVTSIAPTVTLPDPVRAERTITVTTELDNPLLLLKPQMTGNARIYAGKRRIVELVTRRLSRYLRVEFWSWW